MGQGLTNEDDLTIKLADMIDINNTIGVKQDEGLFTGKL